MKIVKNFIIYAIILFSLINNCSSKLGIKYLNPKYPVETRVDDLLKRMTLEEKIGQMTQVDTSYLNPKSDITKYKLGSIICGGDSGPADALPDSWIKMINDFQKKALETRLKIPVLFGIDAIHGNAKVKGAVVFPHNIGIGCIKNPELAKKAAEITATEMSAVGMMWDFAPCIAVVQDERWGRTYEGFSENTEIVKQLSATYVTGLQGNDLSKNNTVLACAKHYLGDGGTKDGIDRGDTQCDEATLRKLYLAPYIEAVNAGVESVMVSFSSWNGKKMHENKYMITDVLKGELGFKGLVVTDWAAHKELAGSTKDQIKTIINAGIDMVMVPDEYKEFYVTLLKLVKDEEVPISRIDDAVKRILRIKFMLGLFENPFAREELKNKIGSTEHRKIARQCVAGSTVLLKNKNNILPLKKNNIKIHVAGKNADNLGYQCGGWTLSWQGLNGNITDGTTILDGIKEALADSSSNVSYSLNALGIKNADVCIVVLGETPYAEFKGDSKDLSLTDEDTAIIKQAHKKGIPVIVVLITGRPIIITKELDMIDALLVAWLPGTEGAGVSDIIFGDAKPTGKLSYSWPKNMKQIPINYGNNEYKPLFPFGYGLTY